LGGVVFRVNPSNGRIALLHNFINQDPSGGDTPAGGLVLGTDGNSYGATHWGGSYDRGTLFEVTKSRVYTQLFAFDGTDGGEPESTAMQHTNGIIYGVTGAVVYSFDVGMKPFIALLFNAGQVGTSVGVLGQGFEGTKKVKFNGVSASFTVVSSTYMTAIVPSGATTGFVTVTMSTGELKSSKTFVVQP
jgi:hypothetical protein